MRPWPLDPCCSPRAAVYPWLDHLGTSHPASLMTNVFSRLPVPGFGSEDSRPPGVKTCTGACFSLPIFANRVPRSCDLRRQRQASAGRHRCSSSRRVRLLNYALVVYFPKLAGSGAGLHRSPLRLSTILRLSHLGMVSAFHHRPFADCPERDVCLSCPERATCATKPCARRFSFASTAFPVARSQYGTAHDRDPARDRANDFFTTRP